jgi:hypothetical protein
MKGLPVFETPHEDWLTEAVQLHPLRGGVRYLLQVHRERCDCCGSGTRTVSFWATARGSGEAVTWCGHCFNATCQRVSLDEPLRVRYKAVRQAVSRGRVSAPWQAARPALEDLERRGLL